MNPFTMFVPKRLKSKLLLALFSVGFFPYLLMLIYTQNLGKEKIRESALNMHHIQIHQTVQQLESELNSLHKELRFLASLEMMNDMIVSDIDQRITQLLVQKRSDLPGEIHLYAIDAGLELIASSDTQENHTFNYQQKFSQARQAGRSHFFTYKGLVLFAPIHGSFKEDEPLGYMFAEYAFTNFKRYTREGHGIRSLIYSKENVLQIGHHQLSEDIIEQMGDSPSLMTREHMIMQEGFGGILQDWSLVYVIEESTAFRFLDEFVYFIWMLFALGVVVIAMISSWISRRILEPISSLSKATKSIISTQDYTTQVQISSQGEIRELANDFNTMVQATNHAFEVLEEENSVRLLRFTQLINIFNHLIATQSEEECIHTVIKELQGLVPDKQFTFDKVYERADEERSSIECMMLYVQDFDHNRREFYGKIVSRQEHPSSDPYEEKFYQSIATMIMLQLDQIRLVSRTEEVSRAKSTFISLMSHELRTPLHTILSAAQYLIGYAQTTPAQQDKIAVMESSAHHLLGMINDILDLVQLEAGKVTAKIEVVESEGLYEVLEEIVQMLQVLSEQKGVELSLVNHLQTSFTLPVDMRLLKQIIVNLISNAIKFTSEGSINVLLEVCEDAVCIEVKDTGIGIAKEDLKHLFKEFSQLEYSRKNQQKGSGLGLAISRRMAQLLGGELELFSEGEGKGTRAVLRLRTTP